MGHRAVLNISLKIVGVYYALSALNMLPKNIAQIIISWDMSKHYPPNYPSMIATIKVAGVVSALIPVLLCSISLAIIFNSERIVRTILRGQYQLNDLPHEVTWLTALDISIKLLGFYAILSAIPYIASVISKYLIMKDNLTLLDNHGKIEVAESVLSAGLYICTGFVLILRSNAMAEKLIRADYLKKNLNDTDET